LGERAPLNQLQTITIASQNSRLADDDNWTVVVDDVVVVAVGEAADGVVISRQHDRPPID
jgi:hypothetical protein